MKNRGSIINVFASVSGLIVLDKILGFIRQMIVASNFGATNETDIISFSQSAVGDIQYVLAQVMITSFVSVYIYSRNGKEGTEDKSKIFAGNVLLSFLGISILITALLELFAPLLSGILAPSYSKLLSEELTKHIRIYSILVVLFSMICIFKAILNANKQFVPEQLISFNQSIITIALVFLIGNDCGPSTLVISFFCYTIWNTVFLGIFCRKRITISISNPIKNVEVKKLFKMMGPLLLGYSLIYINQMVDRTLISGLGEGVITSLTYGATLSNLITTFITTFCNIIFPYITLEISKKEYARASIIANTMTQILIIVFLPITITFFICSHDIVAIVYGHGAFDESAVQSASMALKGYAIMFVPVALRDVYSRFQYAFQDSKRPMLNGSIGIVGNIILSILFCELFGVFGVALATSLSVLISGILNMITARKKTKELNYNALKMFSVKLIMVSGFSILLSIAVFKLAYQVGTIMRIIMVCFTSMSLFALVFGKYTYTSLKKINGIRKHDM